MDDLAVYQSEKAKRIFRGREIYRYQCISWNGGRVGSMEQLSYGILAGGKSRRMGMDKAALKLENQTFLNQLISQFQDKGPLMVSVRDDMQGKSTGVSYLIDENSGIGPIEGIRRLVEWAPTEHMFICACDMPFLKFDLVEYMAGCIDPDHDCYVIQDEGRVHPLCAIYSKRVLQAAEQLIREENHKLLCLLERCDVKKIDMKQSGFPAGYLQNINTKEEYMKCLCRETMGEVAWKQKS